MEEWLKTRRAGHTGLPDKPRSRAASPLVSTAKRQRAAAPEPQAIPIKEPVTMMPTGVIRKAPTDDREEEEQYVHARNPFHNLITREISDILRVVAER